MIFFCMIELFLRDNVNKKILGYNVGKRLMFLAMLQILYRMIYIYINIYDINK